MNVYIKKDNNHVSENIIDIYFLHEDDSVESSTERPETYIEDFQKLFHDFCNDIYNYVQSLERKWLLKIDYDYKNKDGNVLEVGYRQQKRGDTPQSYYIPFHVVKTRGRVERKNNRFMQVRISTHPPNLKEGESLVQIPIKDWKHKTSYDKDKRRAKAYILAEVQDKIDTLRSS